MRPALASNAMETHGARIRRKRTTGRTFPTIEASLNEGRVALLFGQIHVPWRYLP